MNAIDQRPDGACPAPRSSWRASWAIMLIELAGPRYAARSGARVGVAQTRHKRGGRAPGVASPCRVCLRMSCQDRGPGPRTARQQFRETRTTKSLRLRWAVEPRLALAAVPGHVSGARNFSAKKTGREWR